MSTELNPRFYPEQPVDAMAHQVIESQVDKFLSQGGEIQSIPFGLGTAHEGVPPGTFVHTVTCEQCGTDFQAAQTLGQRRKFCKTSCRKAAQKARVQQ